MTTSDTQEIARLFEKTFRREPLGAHRGISEGEGDDIAQASVQDPVSFVIEDTTLPGPLRLVAFRTSCILTAEGLAQKAEKIAKEGIDDSVQAILNRMTELWLAKSTVLETNPSAKVMKFMALGVDTDYEGQGLAKDLLNVSMEKAVQVGCDAVTVVASAFATQHLFSKRLGFELMGRVRYSDFTWVNPKTGKEERPFESLVEPEFLEVYEKRLV
ncbi:hypothetical protein BGZ97_012851 [Linnemannia gamsii]|jgi:N-acetylglutamate synthase-like GNAT family acetyltransferase|uniref:N-acetyltransferase domain-containing protein n=1 Tax=Linnemannia gamsii TaxID=64522 RepID=A0A9P6R4G4_9FUNG|nr:hypothetical protein BGZ97_012851 [Linnemannia gamsii]